MFFHGEDTHLSVEGVTTNSEPLDRIVVCPMFFIIQQKEWVFTVAMPKGNFYAQEKVFVIRRVPFHVLIGCSIRVSVASRLGGEQ